jgi:hypothetical protein
VLKRLTICAAVCCALAGCGSSSNKSGHVAFASQGLKFAACMRANGVPNFPDPSGGGGGIQIPIGSGINPAAPAFQGAQKACRKLMPGGGPPPPATAQDKERMVQLSECMRAHGVPDFPDPVSAPPSNPNEASIAFGRPGLFIVVPNTIDPRSPAFKQAGKTCHFPGFG